MKKKNFKYDEQGRINAFNEPSHATKVSHTPGPWSLEYDHSLVMGKQIVGSAPAPDDASKEERKANANLIAAAPEMLAALEMVRDCFLLGKRALKENEADMVFNALLKARGAKCTF